MDYNVVAVYEKHYDQVHIEAFVVDSDELPVQVDSVELSLMHESELPSGSTVTTLLQKLLITSDYASVDKHFVARIKNPAQKINLVVQAKFTIGLDVTVKKILVGTPDSPQIEFDTPSNEQYIVEIEDTDDYLTGGGDSYQERNEVVLQPELRDLIKEYAFNIPATEDAFEGLSYVGGGSRMVNHLENNMFLKQPLNTPAYALKAYSFLEKSVTNLITDADFKVGTDYPTGWEIADLPNTIVNSTLSFNNVLSTDFKVWKIRLRKEVPEFVPRELVLKNTNRTVVGNTTYTFSTYLKTKANSKSSKLNSIKLILEWFDSSNVYISRSLVTLNAVQYKNFQLVNLTATAPANAVSVSPEIRFGNINAGDDVELYLFTPQLEVGSYPTSRTIGTRVTDVLSVVDINLANFKVRSKFVTGFDSSLTNWFLFEGFIKAYFASGQLTISVGENTDSFYKEISVPFTFDAFEEIDLTLEVVSGDRVKLLSKGNVLAQESLDAFSDPAQTLNIKGAGIELSVLNIYTRG